jgi:hypothetical protein
VARFDTGHHMAELLAGLWADRRSPWFARYIEALCGVAVPGPPELKGVVVSEADDGSVADGMVQSLAVRHWLADDDGFRAIAEADVPPWARDTNAAGDAGRLYSGWAKFHFFPDGEWVSVVAVLGPELRGRMVGRVAVVGGRLAFTDVRVPQPPGVGAVRSQSPVCPALTLGAARQAEPDAVPDPASV